MTFRKHIYKNAFAFIILFTTITLSNTSKSECQFQNLLKNANFHTIETEQCYRARQLSASELEYCIKTNHIKTIINLRGKKSLKRWWRNESRIARKYNINLINIEYPGAHKTLHPNELRKLLFAFTLEKPLLIHCKLGKDRTGFAAGLYQLEHMDASFDRAIRELSQRSDFYIKTFSPKIPILLKNWHFWRKERNLTIEEALNCYQKH